MNFERVLGFEGMRLMVREYEVRSAIFIYFSHRDEAETLYKIDRKFNILTRFTTNF